MADQATAELEAVTETLARLTPAAVATYLVRTGWARMGERNSGTVWTRRSGGGVGRMFQPEDPTSPDYALRVCEMLAALAAAESRSERVILTDLCLAHPGARDRAAGRTDWMEPEYGLRRPELVLVLDLAACRIEREAFVHELEQLTWPHGEAAELAALMCELLAVESTPAERDRGRQSAAAALNEDEEAERG